jgi:hypothetical protein
VLIRQAPGAFDDEIVSYRLLDARVGVLAAAKPGTVYRSLQWYSRRALGLSGTYFIRTSLPASGGTYLFPNSGGPARAFPYGPFVSPAFSPNGEELITLSTSLADSTTVLFLRDIDDPAGVTSRQLTYWFPPTQ